MIMMKLINTDLDAGVLPSADIAAFWKPWLSTDSTFCRALVSSGYLSEEQMLRAADRYHLGRSRDGGVIFWQIDSEGITRDGKIMYYRDDCHRDKSRNPSWCSARMKAYYGYDGDLPVDRCLFGLHLLGHTENTEITEKIMPDNTDRNSFCDFRDFCVTNNTICVVEAEKTAVIMSEVYPQYVWMAAGGLSMLNAEKLRPLSDRHVILFPDTDPDGKAFARWQQVAKEASRHTLFPVYVSPLLERHATPQQKAAKIDLVDFLFSH